MPADQCLAAGGEEERSRAAGLGLAETVFDAYQQKQKEDLGNLLQQISGRVAKIYSALHPGEDLDAVSIEPWTAKGVELAINFYGSRQRPPHGVLSESHLELARDSPCFWPWRRASTRSSDS